MHAWCIYNVESLDVISEKCQLKLATIGPSAVFILIKNKEVSNEVWYYGKNKHLVESFLRLLICILVMFKNVPLCVCLLCTYNWLLKA